MKNRKSKITKGFSLSEKLLILTLLFVMLAEILIFLPSIGNFRRGWLDERLSAAYIAALAVEAAPNNTVPEKLRWELLTHAQVYSVALKKDDQRILILQSPVPNPIEPIVYDLRNSSFYDLITDAIKVYFQPKETLIRVVGKPEMSNPEFIEVLMEQGPLKKEMINFALNILGLSILISMITAALVYLALNRLLVKPIGELTHNMMHFSENPQDPDRKIHPSGRTDEIGTVENELLAMQTDLSTMLLQKTRLANLGTAVSKINHDLRGMLSTAQLVSDRLSGVDDPTVQNVTPRLVRSIDRAIRLCTDTLQYGKADERDPNRTQFPFKRLIAEVLEEQDLPRDDILIKTDIDENAQIYGDYEQLYRVFANLIRNSIQVLEANKATDKPDEVSIFIRQENGASTIDIKDTGPGITQEAREHLFEAFRGSNRKGGTGLGLAITAEILKAHNGNITCEDNPTGAHFQIYLPQNGQVIENLA